MRPIRPSLSSIWVTNEYEATRTIRGENTAWGEVDVTLGEYMSYGSVVKDLGGWEWHPAVAGAKRICAKCVKLSGKWAVKDDFSELLFVLKLKVQHNSYFDKKWSEYTQSLEDHTAEKVCAVRSRAPPPFPSKPSKRQRTLAGAGSEAIPGPSGSRASSGAPSVGGKGDDRVRGDDAGRGKRELAGNGGELKGGQLKCGGLKGGGLNGAQGKQGGKACGKAGKGKGAKKGTASLEGSTPPRGANPGGDFGGAIGGDGGQTLNSLLKHATKLKLNYYKVKNAGTSLIRSITEDGAYRRWRTDEWLKPLEDLYQDMEREVTKFGKEFILHAVGHIKKDGQRKRPLHQTREFHETRRPSEDVR